MTLPVLPIIAVFLRLNFLTLGRYNIFLWAVPAVLYHCQLQLHCSWKFSGGGGKEWEGGPHSDLTTYYESHFIDRERESAFRRNPWRIQIKIPTHTPLLFPRPFLLPAPETHPGKKICIYLQNKKRPPAENTPNAGVIKKQRVLREEEECADGCYGTSCRPPLLLFLLLHSLLFSFFARTFSSSLSQHGSLCRPVCGLCGLR